jgi:hypothetical protein
VQKICGQRQPEEAMMSPFARISGRFRKKAESMFIHSIQYGMKPRLMALWALLSAPVQLLGNIKLSSLTAFPWAATALSRSRRHWQRRDAVIANAWKAPQACN